MPVPDFHLELFVSCTTLHPSSCGSSWEGGEGSELFANMILAPFLSRLEAGSYTDVAQIDMPDLTVSVCYSP